MSTTIDQRVVEMRFDNKQFESNVKTSMSTIDSLKQKLNFTGATKGLDSISNAAKKVNFTSLGSAVETVQAKFSALEVMGVTALANITNSAVNAGKRIISALTIDPVLTGFQEYETQMNAIQTILANTQSKGSTLEDVTAALDELNTYADQTIYNFTEMTKNIGTFTAAGVDLEKSVTSIKGIANLAAVSGSTSAQASTAMYQLSQALAAGKVQLMDWNSVVNAGMGGEVFQTALKRTAENFGTNVDAMIKKYGSFRESLTKGGWLTAEVLTETLTQLSGAYTEADLIAQGYTKDQAKAIVELAETAVSAATDVKTFTQLWDTMKEAVQSGWAQSWKIIIGDFEEAKETFSQFSDLFGSFIQSSADSRNSILEGAMGSKWDQMIKQINDAGIETEKFNEELEKTARASVKNYDTIIEKHGSLAKAFSEGALSSDLIVETLERMAGVTGKNSESTEDMTKKLKEFQKVVDDVWYGDYKNGQERVEALTKAGYNYAEVQALVNKTVDGHRLTLEDLTDTQLKSIGYTDEEVKKLRELAEQAKKTGTPLNELINNLTKPSGRELLWDSILTVFRSILNVASAIGKAWDEIFPTEERAAALYNIIAAFNSFTKNLEASDETLNNITRTFKGLFAILDVITMVVGGGFKAAFTVLNTILGHFNMNILDLTAMVGDAAVALRDFITDNELVAKGIDAIVSGFIWLGNAISDFVVAVKNLPAVQNVIAQVKNGLSQLQEIGTWAIEGLKNGLEDGIKSLPNVLIQIGNTILETIKNVLGIHSPSTETYELGVFTIEGLVQGVKSGAEKLYEVLRTIADKVVSILSNIPWSAVIAGGALVAMVLLANRILNIFDAVTAPFEAFGDVLESVSGTIKSFGKVLNAKAFSIRADGIQSLATAIGILAASLVALSFVDAADLFKSVVAIAALAGVLFLLTKALATVNTVDMAKVGGFSLSLLALAASLVIVAKAIKTLNSLDPNTAADTIAAFVVVVGALTVMLTMLGVAARIGGPNASLFGSMVLKLSVSMYLFVGVIQIVAKMSEEDIGVGVLVLTAFVGFVTLLGVAARIGGPNASKFGSMVLKMSVAMLLFVGVIALIGALNVDDLATGVIALTAFVGIITLLGVVARIAGPNVSKFGGVLLAMSASMGIMALVIMMLADISQADIEKGTKALLGFAGIVALLVTVVGSVGKESAKLGATMLAISVSIGILAAVAVLLGAIDVGQMAKGLTAVGILSLFVSGMLVATKFAQDMKANLIVLTVAIGILAASVAALSFIEPGRLAGATAAVSILMAVFALLIKSSSNVTTSIPVLVIMIAAVGFLALIIRVLSELPVESVLPTVAALSTLLISLAAAMRLMNNVGSVSKGTAASLGLALAALVGIGALLGVLQALNVEPSIETAAALSLLLLSLSAACVILAGVGKTGAAAVQGALVLDGVIVVVGGLMAGIGALVSYFPQLEEFVDKGIGLLEAIGKGIGSFVGGIIGGVLSGITSSLPDIATDLSLFMGNLTPFLVGLKMIDENTLSSVGTLAGIILALTAADVINGIVSFFTGGSSLASFAEQLVPFGEAMAEFSQTIKGKIDPKSMEAVTNAGEMLAELNKSLPKSGGLLQSFLGEQDLGAFSEDMKAFGQAVVDFSEVIAPDGKSLVNEEAVKSAANAGRLISDLNNSLPREGGVLQDFLGTQDLAAFSDDMVAFGEAVVEFSEIIAPEGKSLVNEEAVKSAANAGMLMSELNSSLPREGGVLQDFLGSQDLSAFSDDMVDFGQAVVDFSEIIAPDGKSLINMEAVEAAKNAGTMMTELSNTLPSAGGFLQDFLGEKSLSDFGTELVAFGESLSSYAESVDGISEDTVRSSASAASALVALSQGIPENKWFTNETTLDEFGAQLSEFGSYFADYYSYIENINSAKLNYVIGEIGELVDMAASMNGVDFSSLSNFGKALTDLGKAGIDDLITSFTNANSRVMEAVGKLVTYITNGINAKKSEMTKGFTSVLDSSVTAIKNKYTEFYKTGQTLMTKFADGVSSKESSVRVTVSNMISSLASNIRSEYSSFYSAGGYLVQGFINGMESHMSSVRAAARRIAREAYEAAMDELDAYSPSRVFIKVGSYVAMGFANGMEDNANLVEDSSRSMADTAISTVSNTISRMADLVSSDIDVEPTIRPVLDLSDVESKTSRLNAMFSTSRAMSIGASMRQSTIEDPNLSETTTPQTGTTFQFTQNNYSPKALSRVEIYRQTNNQFSAFERMVRA